MIDKHNNLILIDHDLSTFVDNINLNRFASKRGGLLPEDFLHHIATLDIERIKFPRSLQSFSVG